jgi:hypothetical protein
VDHGYLRKPLPDGVIALLWGGRSLNQKISTILYLFYVVYVVYSFNVIEFVCIYIHIHCIYGCITASMTVPKVSHISLLKKYIYTDANHVIDWNMIQVEPESVLQVHPVHILDRKIKQLRNRAIELVKVQWTWYGPEDVTWEHEDAYTGVIPTYFLRFWKSC